MTEKTGHISYLPTDGLSYDTTDEIYWKTDLLQKEVTRVFEVCQGCRLCFKYCETFPNLFDLIDKQYDGDVRRITEENTKQILDTCFQCKLCEVQCPFTPEDEHEFLLDFPSLVHRYYAVNIDKYKLSFRDRFLGDPDKSAKFARLSLGTANIGNKIPPVRWLLEKILGIHRKKLLPPFAQTTFEKWAKKQGYVTQKPEGELILFQTCYVQNNEPQIGKDTIEVLQKNDIDFRCAKGLKCCGMPAWENGDLKTVRKNAKNNLDILIPFVENGAKIGVINPSCSMMMRKEYPKLLEGEDRERANVLAEAVKDISEYIWSIRKEERFNTDFKSTPNGTISYHVPCHLRAQRIGFPARGLMKKVPETKVSINMECSGHDGTYAMKVESYESSKKVGKKAFDGMKIDEVQVMVSDCPLAAVQFEENLGVKPMHPMSFLAAAYREDGFDQKIEGNGN